MIARIFCFMCHILFAMHNPRHDSDIRDKKPKIRRLVARVFVILLPKQRTWNMIVWSRILFKNSIPLLVKRVLMNTFSSESFHTAPMCSLTIKLLRWHMHSVFLFPQYSVHVTRDVAHITKKLLNIKIWSTTLPKVRCYQKLVTSYLQALKRCIPRAADESGCWL